MVSTEHIDHKAPSIVEGEKDAVVHRELDKFGSWAKSDAREIALVRKLDWYIMVFTSNPQIIRLALIISAHSLDYV